MSILSKGSRLLQTMVANVSVFQNLEMSWPEIWVPDSIRWSTSFTYLIDIGHILWVKPTIFRQTNMYTNMSIYIHIHIHNICIAYGTAKKVTHQPFASLFSPGEQHSNRRPTSVLFGLQASHNTHKSHNNYDFNADYDNSTVLSLFAISLQQTITRMIIRY